MRRGLTARLLAASAVLLLLVGAPFLGLFLAIAELRATDEQVGRSSVALRAATHLEKLLVDMETGLRGFVITREERFLEPWQAGRDAFPREANALAGTSDPALQAARMRTIAESGASYIADYAAPLIDAVRRDDPSASSVETTEAGKQRVDGLRAQLAEYIDAERSIYIARQDAAASRADAAVLVAIVTLGASAVLIALFVGFIARTLVRPVTRAAQMAGRLAAGELTTRMPESGTAEIGTLERSFNSLAASLEDSQAEQHRLLDEQSALRRVATLVAEGRPPDEVFAAVAKEVALLFRTQAALLRYEPDGTVTVVGSSSLGDALPLGTVGSVGGHNVTKLVFETGRSARIAGVSSAVGVPISVEGRLWGAAVVSIPRETGFPVGTEERLADFSALVGTGISNAETRAELAASRARVVAASDDARRRLERNLHDGAQQRLVSLGLTLRSVELTIPPELEETRAGIRQVVGEVTGVIDELREISRGIYPASLSRGGLAAAVRTLARRSVIPVRVEINTQAPLPERVQAAGYYVVAEALTNAAKHAAAREVQVTLEDQDGMLRVSVRDDGVGGADPTGGSGLTGLRDRVEALGGRLKVASPPGGGTLIVAEIPSR